MADRILKPDSGNDLVLQNDDGSGKIEINENASIPVTGTLDVSGATLTTSSAQKQAIVQAGPGSGTLDVSSGTFTTSSAQKQAIVDGATISAGDITSGTFSSSVIPNLAGDKITSGTLSSTVQNNITSLGTLASATISGDLTVDTSTLKVDSSNNRVGVGEASPDNTLHVSHSSTNTTIDDNSSPHCAIMLQNTSNTDGNYSGIWNQDADNSATNSAIIFKNVSQTDSTSSMHFMTRPSGLGAQERAKITKEGDFKASNGDNVGSDNWSTTSVGHVFHTASSARTVTIENSHDSAPYGLVVDFSDANPNSTTYWYFLAINSTNNANAAIYSNGNLANSNNSYGTFSDERLKTNISEASSQWNDIKALNFKKYKLKEHGENARYHLGLIAQDLEKTSPNLVEEYPASEYHIESLGFGKDEMVKGIKSSVVFMKGMKALQEAMSRIETLESKVTALENT